MTLSLTSRTATEILQQPEVWRDVAALAAGPWSTHRAALRPLLATADLRIVLTGAGTSSFVGSVLAGRLRRALGLRVDAVATTDMVAAPDDVFAEDVPTLLVSFARSGDSPESLVTTGLADRLLTRCEHLIITCHADGALARAHDGAEHSRVLVLPERADDQGFAMTSSFTGMTLAALLVLDPDADAVDVDALARAGDGVLAEVGERARTLLDHGIERLVFLGSGALAGLARESALKVVELTAGRVMTLAETSLGFRHGPKAVLDDRTAAIVAVSADPYTRRYDLDMAAELVAALPDGHGIRIDTDAGGPGVAWTVPRGTEPQDGGLADVTLALLGVLHAQTLGLLAAEDLGLDPDNPFPSGAVNRVVTGVHVHPYPDPVRSEARS